MKNDKAPKNKTTDSDRETRVLLEGISKQVQTIAEGHGIIIRKLDGHDQRLGRIEHVLDGHSQRFDRIERDLDTVKSAVMDISHETKGLASRVKKVEEKVFV